jgi:predicted RNA-binding Zn-ribbon protein involved in translation (DUF1610 family)
LKKGFSRIPPGEKSLFLLTEYSYILSKKFRDEGYNLQRKPQKYFYDESAKIFNILHNEKGESLRKIAKKSDTTHNTIKNTLLRYGYPYRKRKYLLNENYFSKIENSLEKQYILGWIYSDGSVFGNKKGYGFSLKIQQRDSYILEYIKKCLETDTPIRTESYNGRIYPRLTILSKAIYEDLLKYGLMPNKTFKLKYPEELKIDHRAFILGVFDGDGAIYFNKSKMPRFSITGTWDMLNGIKNIIKEEIKINETSFCNKKNKTFELCYVGPYKVSRIYSWLYSWEPKVCLRRKKQVFDKISTINKYGKNMVIFRCPECGEVREFEKRTIYQLKKYTFKSKFCSLKCSGKFYRTYQLNGNKLSLKMQKAIESNIIGYKRVYQNNKIFDRQNRKKQK